jgi:hypothetical protein
LWINEDCCDNLQTVPFMEQKLTRLGFIELFTDDDMNIPTMRGLLKRIHSGKEQMYNKHRMALDGVPGSV